MTTRPLIVIGYWQSERQPELPRPEAFVDDTWDEHERYTIESYLRHAAVHRAYLGLSRCRLCGQPNGSLEQSDGTYAWPEGLAHYVEAHGVRLPGLFVEHALQRIEALEQRPHDETWWRSLRK